MAMVAYTCANWSANRAAALRAVQAVAAAVGAVETAAASAGSAARNDAAREIRAAAACVRRFRTRLETVQRVSYSAQDFRNVVPFAPAGAAPARLGRTEQGRKNQG